MCESISTDCFLVELSMHLRDIGKLVVYAGIGHFLDMLGRHGVGDACGEKSFVEE